jgi:hypothetical protein
MPVGGKMSEEKSLRTRDQINQDYTNCAARLGNAYFQLDLLEDRKSALEDEVGSIKDQMRGLNQEPCQGATS